MGAAASFLKRKGKNGNEGEKEPTTRGEESKEAPKEEEEEEIIEGVDEVFVRIVQMHHAQTKNRWVEVTKKVNSALHKQGVDVQELKDQINRIGIGVPECWEQEMVDIARKAREKSERKAMAAEEELQREVERQLAGKQMGKKKAKAPQPKKEGLKSPKEKGSSGSFFGIGKRKQPEPEPKKHEEEEGGSDTDSMTSADTDVEVGNKGGKGNGKDKKEEVPPVNLTKYEVFSFMRRLHKMYGPNIVEEEQVKSSMKWACQHLDAIFESCTAEKAKVMSQEARIKGGINKDTLAYGEIDVATFIRLVAKLQMIHGHMSSQGGTFYDLGSGVGRLVLASALMHDFDWCYGIESLSGLQSAAKECLERYVSRVLPTLPSNRKRVRVDLFTADALQIENWVKEATVVVCNMGLSPTQLDKVKEMMASMKVGALAISAGVPAVLPDKWGLLAEEEVQTTWGLAPLFIHEKLAA
ncbi:unnamed protein product [Chrysoparadoxa australica]